MARKMRTCGSCGVKEQVDALGYSTFVQALGVGLLAVVVLASCTAPTPPREASLGERIKKDCAEAAGLLVEVQGVPADAVESRIEREDEVTKKCIRVRALRFINGGGR